MGLWQEGVFLLVLFLANTIQAITGFAGTLLAMPPSILLIGPDQAKVVLNIMAFISSLLIAATSYRDIAWRQLAIIVVYMLCGMAGGIWLYQQLPLAFLLTFYGCFVLAVAVHGFFSRRQPSLGSWPSRLLLFAAGLMHGMFVSGGALLVIYAVAVFKDTHVFRATLAAVWIFLSLPLMMHDCRQGFFTVPVLTLTAVSIVPLVLATFAGTYIHDRIGKKIFLKLSYGLLVLSGILIIF